MKHLHDPVMKGIDNWSASEFRTALEQLNMTQAAFSRLTKINIRSVAAYASGETRVPLWMPIMVKGVRLILKFGDLQ